jgi:L-idonate 5-dehydrogenase
VKAVVVHGPGDLRVDELPDPVPGPGEVLLSVEWGGICGSDLSYWRHGASGTAVLRRPLVLGHEVAGRLATGEPVTVHPATASGELPARLAGRTNLSPRVRYFGSAAFDPHTDGAFCELKVVRADQVRPLPDNVDTRQGALAEPLAVALHAVSRAGDIRGRDVLVNGAGPIGALVVAAARYRGARTVIAADVAAAPLAVAKAMGADETHNATEGLPEDVEVVFEASGAPGALGAVLAATARGGTVVQVGNLPGNPAPAALGALVTKEITWLGSYRFVEEITDAISALQNGLNVSPLITHEFPITEAPAAFAAATTPTSSKVLLNLASPTEKTRVSNADDPRVQRRR